MTKRFFRTIIVLLFGIAMCLAWNNIARAEDTSSSDLGISAFLGNKHTYNVTVKKNGSIAVIARIILANATNQSKTDFTLGLPDGLSGQPLAIQQILGRECSKSKLGSTAAEDKCLEYIEPDYWNYQKDYYDLDEKSEYKKATVTVSGSELKITLPDALKPDKGGAVILSYYQTGQIKSGWFEEKNLKFQSIADPAVVRSVSVKVSSDSDIYTSKGRSSISDYNYGSTISSMSSLVGAASSKSMDQLVSDITDSYGSWLNKNGSDLSPNERFAVTGKFSANWWGYYWKTIGIGLIVLIAVIAILYFLIKKLSRGATNANRDAATSQNATAPRVTLSFREAMTLREILVSLVVLVVGIGIPILINLLSNRAFGYVGTYALVSLTYFISYALGAAIIVGYLIFRAAKYGLAAAGASVVSCVIWLLLLLIVYVVIILSTENSNNFSSDYYGSYPASSSSQT